MALTLPQFFRGLEGALNPEDSIKRWRVELKELHDIVAGPQDVQKKLELLNQFVEDTPGLVGILPVSLQAEFKKKQSLPDSRWFQSWRQRMPVFSIIPGSEPLATEFTEIAERLKKLQERLPAKQETPQQPVVAKFVLPSEPPQVKDFFSKLTNASGDKLKLPQGAASVKHDNGQTSAEFAVYGDDQKDTGRKVTIAHEVKTSGPNSTAKLTVSGGMRDVIDAVVAALGEATKSQAAFSFDPRSVVVEGSSGKLSKEQEDKFYEELKMVCAREFGNKCVLPSAPQTPVKATLGAPQTPVAPAPATPATPAAPAAPAPVAAPATPAAPAAPAADDDDADDADAADAADDAADAADDAADDDADDADDADAADAADDDADDADDADEFHDANDEVAAAPAAPAPADDDDDNDDDAARPPLGFGHQ